MLSSTHVAFILTRGRTADEIRVHLEIASLVGAVATRVALDACLR